MGLWAPAAAAVLLQIGCVGDIGGEPEEDPGVQSVQGESPTSAIPRLSRREIDATVLEVFGIAGAADKNLPADPKSAVNPGSHAEEEVYDTLAATKSPSQVFVEGLESLAFEVARDFSADTAAVDALAGCSPAGPDDTACLTQLVRNAGLRVWHRPLADDEVDALVTEAAPFATDPAAAQEGFYMAARAVVASLLVSPEFVYRVEIGTNVADDVVELDNYEMLAKLSYFLWGTTPTNELLAKAGNAVFTDSDITDLVDAMLADPRAEKQMRKFHELWLRYDALLVTDPDLAADMRAETDALVDRALTGEDPDWTRLMTSTETFVTPALATHYGLATIPTEASWVSYDDDRAGLLSQGSFLSLSETRLTETLPSRRGAMIGRRLLCEVILPPPPNVAIDKGVEVPEGSCKSDAYAAHRTGTCKGCHDTIDGIGFGFERYDGLGRYREVEQDNASCDIPGEGTAEGKTFAGPRDFATKNIDLITQCAVANLVRFAVRDWSPSADRVDRMIAAFGGSHYDFSELVRSLALDPSFRYRVVAPED